MVRLPWRARWLVLVGIGVVGLVGGALAAQADQSISQTMTEFSFEHPDVTVQTGETAHFILVNAGRFPHSMTIEDVAGVTLLGAPDDNLAPGESGTLDAVFSAPGTYQFWCPVSNHREQGMVGTVTVLAAAAPAQPAAPAAAPAPTVAAVPAAPSPPAPRARDGQSLDTQSAATRASFIAVWGFNQAGADWVKEHEAALSSQGH